MASTVDKQLAVARVWSDALAGLAVAAGRDAETLAELEELAAQVEAEPSLRELFASPLVDETLKGRLIERMLRGTFSDLLVDTLQIMRRKKRLALLRALAQVYREGWLRRTNQVEVRVFTAVPLGEQLREELRLTAAERTNRRPILVEKVDPSLLGGIIVGIDDFKYDGTVARELERFESLLLDRASLELISGKPYFIEST